VVCAGTGEQDRAATAIVVDSARVRPRHSAVFSLDSGTGVKVGPTEAFV
jgi:hypothetical protein